jgi:hypothetical protein
VVGVVRWLADRLWPRNWLDTAGLGIEIVGLVIFIDAITQQSALDSANWWLALALRGVAVALSFVGYLIRRVARKEPIFRERRKPGA